MTIKSTNADSERLAKHEQKGVHISHNKKGNTNKQTNLLMCDAGFHCVAPFPFPKDAPVRRRQNGDSSACTSSAPRHCCRRTIACVSSTDGRGYKPDKGENFTRILFISLLLVWRKARQTGSTEAGKRHDEQRGGAFYSELKKSPTEVEQKEHQTHLQKKKS